MLKLKITRQKDSFYIEDLEVKIVGLSDKNECLQIKFDFIISLGFIGCI